MNSNKITNLTPPTAPSDAANKSYVDSAASAAQSAATAVGNAAQTTANTAKTTADALVVTTSAGSATTSAMRLYPATGTTATIVTNGVTRMTVTTDGKVGIGTTTPSVPLDVNGEGNILTGLTIGTIGNSSTISNSFSEKLSIYHATDARIFMCNGTNAAGLLISNSFNNSFIVHRHTNTDFLLGCEQNVPMKLKTSNTDRMTITGGGNIGIGTSAPTAKLHVSGGAQAGSGYVNYLFIPDKNFYGTGPGGNIWYVGIYCEEILRTGASIVTFSDKRIKKNIRDIEGITALSQIRKIQPTLYNYIDHAKGTQNVYGFIAQYTEDIITDSSIKTTDYIPNFYCKGIIKTIDQTNHIYEISSENELKFEKVIHTSGNEISNYKIKLYDHKNNQYTCTVIHHIDGKTIRVKCDKEYVFSTTEEYKNAVFIYGQEVNDFYNLDENAIFTVATAALQEVDRQQQADKARIAELEATVATQQSLINDILERLKTLERG